MFKYFGKIKVIKSTRLAAFSLLEVAVSMMIIGLVASYLAITIPTMFLISHQTEDISKSTGLAQKYIEDTKYELSSDVQTFDNTLAGNTPPITITSADTDNGRFSITTNITNVNTELIEGTNIVTLKRIDVSYKKSQDNSTLVAFSTYVRRPG